MNRTVSLLRNFVLALSALACGSASCAQRSPARTGDSLRNLYVSATLSGNRFVVDQGYGKALFSLLGEAVTPFRYRDVRPGLDGNFIVLAFARNLWQLVDSNGGWLRDFSGETHLAAGPRGAFYAGDLGLPASDAGRTRHPGEAGFTPVYDTQSYRQGFVRLQHWNYELQGLESTAGDLLIPTARYRSITFNRSGIAAQTDDTCFAYDAVGRPRFHCRADESVQLPGGIVGVSLYGQWALKDSSGRPLSEYRYSRTPQVVGSYIMLNSGVWDFSGRLRLKEPLQSMYEPSPGLYETDGYENDDDRLLDSALNPLFPAGMFENTRLIGRYVLCYKSYYGRPTVYDRYTRTFVGHLVENLLPGGIYTVYDKTGRTRRIMKNGKLQPVPAFNRFRLEQSAGLILLERDTASRKSYGDADDDRLYSNLTFDRRGVTYALMDTSARLLLPMRYSGIEVLSAAIIAAADRKDSSLLLLDRSGKAFYKTRLDGAHARRVGGIVYVTSQTETVVYDTGGRQLYRGAVPPELLYVGKYRPFADYNERSDPSALPALLMQEERLGQWSLRTLADSQVLPGTYRPVRGKMTGLFSLKRGDSLYNVNHAGRLLYGGRGFSADSWLPLESYAALVKDEGGKWGMIDAEGRVLLPFIYDSAGRFQLGYNDPVSQYFLRSAGRYSWIDNAGRVLSENADWLPAAMLFGDFYWGSNSRVYYLSKGRAVEFPDGLPAGAWPRADFGGVYFYKMICCGEKTAGIYNERLQRVATTDRRNERTQFWLDKAVVFDSAGTRLQVVDTNGRILVPLSKAPVVMMIGEKGNIALDSNGTARIYPVDGSGAAPEIVVSDTASTGRLLAGGDQSVNRITPFVFLDRAGRPAGYINGKGEVVRPGIEAVRYEAGFVLLKFSGGWGLYDYGMEPVAPLLFDSIVYRREGFLLYKGGLQGLFFTSARYRGYIPPLYERLEELAQLQNGYLIAATGDSLYLIDRRGRPLTTAFEDFKMEYNNMLNAMVTVRGQQLRLHLDKDGVVRMRRNVPGEEGAQGPYVEVVWQGDKAGLRNTAADTLTAPVRYDFIGRKASGHFVAWRYKADWHEGTDSTLVYDAAGRKIFSLKGGSDPEFKDGFWTMNPGGGSPLLTAGGKEMLGEGYTLSKVLGGRLLLVYKDRKAGLLSPGGKWLLRPELDGIETGDFEKTGLMIGKLSTKTATGSTEEKYLLIGSTGKRLTPAIYDSLEIEDETLVIFERGERSGCLNAAGKKVRCREEE